MDHLLNAFTGRYAWAAPLIAAPFVGSFLGVLIDRPPGGRPVAPARPRCRCALSAVDMLLWISFAALRGRCRTCGDRIGWFAPGARLAATVVAAWAATVVQDVTIWLSC